MIALEAQVNADELKAAIARAPEVMLRRLRDSALTVLRGFLRDFLATTPVRLGTGGGDGVHHPGLGRIDQWPIRASGNTINALRVRVSNSSPVAKTLQKGKTMQARRGSLTIPLTKEFRTVAEAIAAGKKLFARKVKRKTILFARDGKTIRPMFVLVAKVRIKAQLGFYEEWDGPRQENRVEYIADQVTQGIREVFGPDAVVA